MKCKCPSCGAIMSLDVLLQHEQASKAVFNALAINGDLGRLLIQYLGLFRPAKSSLTMDRTAKLLNDLVEHINSGYIMRNGQKIPAAITQWIDALQILLNSRHKIRCPLSSHGYLFEIIASNQPKAHNGVVIIDDDIARPARTFSSKTGLAVSKLAEFANE